jgi:hypothetical protein
MSSPTEVPEHDVQVDRLLRALEKAVAEQARLIQEVARPSAQADSGYFSFLGVKRRRDAA